MPSTCCSGSTDRSDDLAPAGRHGPVARTTVTATMACVLPTQAIGAYVHIPFCARRCDYCAFATWTDRHHLTDRYLSALRTEIRRAVADGLAPVTSVFVGGGTPSMIEPSLLVDVLAELPLAGDAEVTVECNPDNVTDRLAETYRRGGVNRISLGVQSMVPRVLHLLGRTHDPANVRRAVEAIRGAGFDTFNLDVIYGAAGETLDEWRITLDEIAALDPPHVSAYGLTVEQGTPLADDPARYPDDDDQADKYEMTDAALTRFTIEPNADPVPEAERARRMENPGFGKTFTDHMAIVRYVEGKGWHDAKITARGPITLDPAAAVLHYAQEIFEGLKAYRLEDGAMALFRADANARRFNASARRMAMPELPEELFVESCRLLAQTDAAWFPPIDGGSIYLRPFMIASEVFLGVKPSAEYLYIVIAASTGNYFKSGAPAVRLLVAEEDTRAAPGGTGAAKCGGNYAASLRAQQAAIAQGFDQVVFLDARERRFVEELGGMNLFFVFDDGTMQTPPLDGTILPGITRDSLLTLAREQGLTVREEPYAIDQWRADAESGRLIETFACGTAAVVTPVGSVTGKDFSFTIGSGGPGQATQALKQRLVDIQRGIAPDPHGWVDRIG